MAEYNVLVDSTWRPKTSLLLLHGLPDRGAPKYKDKWAKRLFFFLSHEATKCA